MIMSCLNCKHKFVDINVEPCKSCVRMTKNDNWEPIE